MITPELEQEVGRVLEMARAEMVILAPRLTPQFAKSLKAAADQIKDLRQKIAAVNEMEKVSPEEQAGHSDSPAGDIRNALQLIVSAYEESGTVEVCTLRKRDYLAVVQRLHDALIKIRHS